MMTEKYIETWYHPAFAIFTFSLLSAITGLPVTCGIRHSDGAFVIELTIPPLDEEDDL